MLLSAVFINLLGCGMLAGVLNLSATLVERLQRRSDAG